MTTEKPTTPLRVALLVSALIAAGPALAAASGAPPGPARDCNKHGRNSTPCHVHDEDTYQHMRMQERDKIGVHARLEMKKYQQKERQSRR